MNKFILLTLLACSLNINLFAQITATNAILPQIGDINYMARDTATPGVLITAPGGNQTWVFDNFIPPYADTLEVIDAAQGSVAADFPDADIVVPQFGGEGYGKLLGDSLEIIGFYGDGGVGIAANFSVGLNPTMIAVQTPINYLDEFEDDFAFQTEFDPDDFPALAALLDSLSPVPIDSVRVIYSSFRNDTIDAWGQLTTNHGTFDVLRMKRVERTDTGFEVKVPIFGWIDPNTIVTLPFAGADTTTYYDFIAEGESMQIMSVMMNDQGGISRIVYKVDPSEVVPPSAIFEPLLPPTAMQAYPNPAFEQVRFEFKDLPSGEYHLHIYNPLGRLIRVDKLGIQGDYNHEMNVKSLPTGAYLYSLKNGLGKTLLTKRMMVF